MVSRVRLPLDKEVIRNLKAGDRALLSGPLYTARDAAHKEIYQIIRMGGLLPFDLEGETFYYTGPCPAAPGRIIGSAGPTTSGRMDKYTPELIRNGLLGMIGKGERDPLVIDAVKKYGAVYFGATGGAGALLSTKIISSELIAFPELGTEAVRRIVVEDFPVIVIIDSSGRDLYKINTEKYRI